MHYHLKQTWQPKSYFEHAFTNLLIWNGYCAHCTVSTLSFLLLQCITQKSCDPNLHLYQLIFKSTGWTDGDENQFYAKVKRDESTGVWILALSLCRVEASLSLPLHLSVVLISCSIFSTSLHSCLFLCAHTSAGLILQVASALWCGVQTELSGFR